MSRRRLALGAGVVVFLAASVIIGRWLAADGAERAKVERLLEAQARGDVAAMAEEVERREGLDALAARLKGPGEVEIVRYDSATSHALSSTTGLTRVVWRRGEGLPTVQCFSVRREGGVLTGPRVTLTGVTAPIGREASC